MLVLKSYVLSVGTPIVKKLISRKITYYLFVWDFGWESKINLKKYGKILNKKD